MAIGVLLTIFVTMFGWGTGCLISQSLPRLLEDLGGAGVFGIYGGATAVAVLFIATMVPETKGRTLEEIEQFWSVRSFCRTVRQAKRLI